ncbi:MFS transporter [soil metagenome]
MTFSTEQYKLNLKKQVPSYFVLFVAAVYFFYCMVQLSVFNALSQKIMVVFSLSYGQFGYLSSVYLYAMAIALFPIGMLFDRFSIRKIFLISMGLIILAVAILALTSNVFVGGMCRAVCGIAHGIAFLGGLRLASKCFPLHSVLATGVFISIGLTGGIVAATPFAALVNVMDWRIAMLLNAFVGLLFWIMVFIVIHDDKPNNKLQQTAYLKNMLFWHQIKNVMMNRQNWLCGLYIGLLNLSVYLLASLWGNVYLIDKYHIPNNTAAAINSMVFLGIIIGSPIAGWISDRLERRKLPMMLGAALTLITIVIIIKATTYSSLFMFTAFLLLGVFSSAQVIGFPSITESNLAVLTSTAMGFATFIVNILGGLGQSLFGWLMQYHNNLQLSTHTTSIEGSQMAIFILPISFLIAFIATLFMRETFISETKRHRK